MFSKRFPPQLSILRYCTYDTAPTLDLLAVNALAAAEEDPSHCEKSKRRRQENYDNPPISPSRRQEVRVCMHDEILLR
jgi:hypothetical protein